MGGDDSQKLLPWRGILLLSRAQTSGSLRNQHCNGNGATFCAAAELWLSYRPPGSLLESRGGSLLPRAEVPGIRDSRNPRRRRYFHTVYYLTERVQVPGKAHLGLGYKIAPSATSSTDGNGAHWLGIYEEKGRIMVAVSYTSDIGDAWEYADDAWYPA